MPWYDGWLDDGTEPLDYAPDRGRALPPAPPPPDPEAALNQWCARLRALLDDTDPEPLP